MSEAMHLDFETRSVTDLAKCGVHRYAAHESTRILCAAYSFGDGPLKSWLWDFVPEEVLEHVRSGGKVLAHHAGFERAIWNAKLRVPLLASQMDCTMARAQALALPASLDELAKAMNLPVNKDKEGRRLMLSMCKPMKTKDGSLQWREDEESLLRLVKYCMRDVEVERAADKMLPPLSARERRVWLLDQTINDRGIPVDLPLIERASAVAKLEAAHANAEIEALTGGAVTKTSQNARMAKWVADQGVDTSNGIGKTVIADIRAEAGEKGLDNLLAALSVRSDAAKSSVAKFDSIAGAASADGRVRNVFSYHGATTGRWAGRLIQPHNMPRVDEDTELPTVREIIGILGDYDAEAADAMINLYFGKPLPWLSKTIRATIRAQPGNRFIGGDFSNIEGRVNAWIAGEQWKLDAFRAYDEGTGDDLYKLAYAKSFGIPVTAVDRPKRQIGKVMELALGYQGGVGAFQKMAGGYGLSVSDDEADDLKRAWRSAHPRIVQGWWDLQDAAILAVDEPGMIVPVFGGLIKYLSKGGFLHCLLPSGRAISYARPSCVWKDHEYKGETITRRSVRYMGVDSLTKAWSEQFLYGGLQCENVVQAVARDILVEAMFRLEAAGYPVFLHVHDEAVVELPAGQGSAAEFETIMSHLPRWAAGLPVATKAFEDERYVK